MTIPDTTECEIQAELYHQCRLAGIKCRLEIHTRCGRPDALICTPDGAAVYLVIECKTDDDKLCPRQLSRYRGLGIDVMTLCAMHEIPRLISRIQAYVIANQPIQWSGLLNRFHALEAKNESIRIRSLAKRIPTTYIETVAGSKTAAC